MLNQVYKLSDYFLLTFQPNYIQLIHIKKVFIVIGKFQRFLNDMRYKMKIFNRKIFKAVFCPQS